MWLSPCVVVASTMETDVSWEARVSSLCDMPGQSEEAASPPPPLVTIALLYAISDAFPIVSRLVWHERGTVGQLSHVIARS